MFVSLSNELLLGIVIGIALTLLFQIAQRTASSAQRRLPVVILFVLLIGALVLLLWWRGV